MWAVRKSRIKNKKQWIICWKLIMWTNRTLMLWSFWFGFFLFHWDLLQNTLCSHNWFVSSLLYMFPCNNPRRFETHTLLLLLFLFCSFVDAIFLLVVMLHILISKRLSFPFWASALNWQTRRSYSQSTQFTLDQINPGSWFNPLLSLLSFYTTG